MPVEQGMPSMLESNVAADDESMPQRAIMNGKELTSISSTLQKGSSINGNKSILASKVEKFRKHLTPEGMKNIWDYVDELKQQVQHLEARTSNDDDQLIHSEFTNKFKSSVQCPICLDYLTGTFSLECGHSYCYLCLKPWLGTNKHCPTCRTPVKRKPNLNMAMTQQAELVCEYAAFYDPKDTTALERLRAANEEVKNMEDVWEGVKFETDRPPRIVDTGDGVQRCGVCAWELVDGECQNCGEVYSDSESDDNNDHIIEYYPVRRRPSIRLTGPQRQRINMSSLPLPLQAPVYLPGTQAFAPPSYPRQLAPPYHGSARFLNDLRQLVDDEVNHSDMDDDDDWVDENEEMDIEGFIDDETDHGAYDEGLYDDPVPYGDVRFSPTQEDEYDHDHEHHDDDRDPDEMLERAVVEGYNRSPSPDDVSFHEDYHEGLDQCRLDENTESNSDGVHDDFEEDDDDEPAPARHHQKHSSRSSIHARQSKSLAMSRQANSSHSTSGAHINNSSNRNQRNRDDDSIVVAASIDSWNKRFRESRRQRSCDSNTTSNAFFESAARYDNRGSSSSQPASSSSPMTSSPKRGKRRANGSSSGSHSHSNDNSDSEHEYHQAYQSADQENDGSSSDDDFPKRRNKNKGKSSMRPPRRRRRLLSEDGNEFDNNDGVWV